MSCTTKHICKVSTKVHSGQYFDQQHKSLPKPGPEFLWCTKRHAFRPTLPGTEQGVLVRKRDGLMRLLARQELMMMMTKCKAWRPNGLCVPSQVIVIFSNRQDTY